MGQGHSSRRWTDFHSNVISLIACVSAMLAEQLIVSSLSVSLAVCLSVRATKGNLDSHRCYGPHHNIITVPPIVAGMSLFCPHLTFDPWRRGPRPRPHTKQCVQQGTCLVHKRLQIGSSFLPTLRTFCVFFIVTLQLTELNRALSHARSVNHASKLT